MCQKCKDLEAAIERDLRAHRAEIQEELDEVFRDHMSTEDTIRPVMWSPYVATQQNTARTSHTTTGVPSMAPWG